MRASLFPPDRMARLRRYNAEAKAKRVRKFPAGVNAQSLKGAPKCDQRHVAAFPTKF